MLGTCNPAKNWTYNEIYKPHKEGKLPANKVFIQALLDDNPHLPKSYAESLENMNDKVSIQRLRHGLWEYDSNPFAMMEYDKICDVFTNEIEEGSFYITCDVARYGQDKTVICVWKGLKCIHIESHDITSVTDTANRINEIKQHYRIRNNMILVDEDGVGGGVKDIVNCTGS